MRRGRKVSVLATVVALATVLAGCASSDAGDARPIEPESQQTQQDSSRSPQSSTDDEGIDVGPLGESPDHMGMPPEYEPLQILPASGEPQFPAAVGDGFEGGTEINEYDYFTSTMYTDDDYNILSVRVANHYLQYNTRDLNYDNLHYVDGVLCGSSTVSGQSEVGSRSCWMLGTEGTVWISSYSAEISFEELSAYLQRVYSYMAEHAKSGS